MSPVQRPEGGVGQVWDAGLQVLAAKLLWGLTTEPVAGCPPESPPTSPRPAPGLQGWARGWGQGLEHRREKMLTF